MTVYSHKHIVVFPAHMWGHARTMCTLVARLVKLRPVAVTFFASNSHYDRIKAEVVRDFLTDEEHFASRIRLIGLADGTEVFNTSGLQDSFEAAWANIMKGEPVVCAKTGMQFDPYPVLPSVAIFDLFVHRAFEIVKQSSAHGVKCYAWVPLATHSMQLIIREGNVPSVEMSATAGVSKTPAVLEHFFAPSGELIHSPCFPPMYDYEYHPQSFAHRPEFMDVVAPVPELCRTCDGLITFDAADYQPEATNALRSWIGETGRKVYYAGPLIPQGQEETLRDPRSDKVLKFLEDRLVSHGAKSVIYISFGSLFWPTDPAKLWAVLDVMMEKNIPFVMSSAAASATSPPAEVQSKIAEYGNALLTDWVPQQALLDHPATGWYICHGGHNSTLETIMAGVPTILWPIDADQPGNAIYLSEGLDVAYELIEVRHGLGAGKIYRSGRTPVGTIDAVKKEMHDVLERAYGEDGARKRAKLQSLRKTLQTAWSESGVARREVEAFLDDI